ncbi:hypothetical protein [Mucilaginibacter celer]|nr:hypothetical protein [Mucilaginibacter celer]
MKKFYCLVLLALMTFASCKKGELSGNYGEDNGCINRVKRDYSDSNKTELAAAVSLLQKNNISLNGLVITRVILNDSITTNGPLTIYQHVVASEESKGLPIFNSGMGYHFRDGTYYLLSGRRYGTLNLDTKASATLPQIRKIFIDAFNKDGYKDGHVDASSCVRAEFGYYNLAQDTPDQPHFVKAWKITFNNWDYPEAYIQDDNRKLLSYFNGIMTVVNANKW